MEDRNEVTQYETGAKLQACEIELCITREAWAKLMGYCRATDLEVSGFMLIERDGDLIMVTDCFIADQISTSASTEMDTTAISKLQVDLFKRKIIGQPDQEGKVKLGHFHTHPTFNVFWSGTDMEMRNTLRKGTDYYVSLVINQKGDALAAIDINGEFPMSISNLPIVMLDDQDVAKACKLEVEAKVKAPDIQTYGTAQTRWMADDRDSYLPGLTQPRIAASTGKPDRRCRDTGAQTYQEWRAERDALQRNLEPERYCIDSGDGMWSNENGTYANIGGEVVKIDGPEPI